VTGIIAFQNEEYYYPLSAARVTGRAVVRMKKDVREGLTSSREHEAFV
jgi:hypothetical protein